MVDEISSGTYHQHIGSAIPPLHKNCAKSYTLLREVRAFEWAAMKRRNAVGQGKLPRAVLCVVDIGSRAEQPRSVLQLRRSTHLLKVGERAPAELQIAKACLFHVVQTYDMQCEAVKTHTQLKQSARSAGRLGSYFCYRALDLAHHYAQVLPNRNV